MYRALYLVRRLSVTLAAKEAQSNLSSPLWGSFNELFQENWSRVYRLLFRMTGDHAEAEDLALEVFWRLHDTPPSVSDNLNIKGWLYRVAVNLGYNALRGMHRRSLYEASAGRRELDNVRASDPAVEVERTHQRQQVHQVLAEMKPRSAHILIMRHSGFTYAEIAATVGIRPGSVGTLLARAEYEFQKLYTARFGSDA